MDLENSGGRINESPQCSGFAFGRSWKENLDVGPWGLFEQNSFFLYSNHAISFQIIMEFLSPSEGKSFLLDDYL